MPELPDVEAQRRVAQEYAVGRAIRKAGAPEPEILRDTTSQGLGRALARARITAARRHGKWLWLKTDRRSDVLVHFGMTGSFHWHPEGAGACEHDLVGLDLDRGTFAHNATRKLGGIWLVRGAGERGKVTGPLGIDALEAGEGDLRDALSGSRAALKPALMDQARIAGLGNLLADELCWQARLHPATPCREVPRDAYPDLARGSPASSRRASTPARVPARAGYLTGARDAQDPGCPRCGAPLARGTIGGRSTRWCPRSNRTRADACRRCRHG